LFHCLCGHPPFPEANLMSQMLKHATERPPLISSIVPDVPVGLQSILDSMLAKVPDDRYATPAAAADALKPFLGSSGVAPVAAAIVPAFKDWLDTESHLEMPKITPQAPTAPNKPSPPGPVKPGAAPSPALAMASPAVKDSTTPRTSGSKAVPVSPARPMPVAPARPPASPRPAPVDEVDVELVLEPLPGQLLVPTLESPPIVQDNRPLWEFNRRDWIMLAAGAAGVLGAVGVGYGLARLVRKKSEETSPSPDE
jgi:eukaryotic-like serine/threonine-protein kinase